MDRLRSPDGCPWDREQDYGTLRSYLLEECYEVVDAIDENDLDALREELGDLLFQIVFLSRLAKEEGRFTASDVVRGIAEKMIRRHPHVFGSTRADTSGEVLRNWEKIKRHEKENSSDPRRSEDGSILAGIPGALPALLKAQRLGTKAARIGFDWERDEDLLEKVEEELAELREALAGGAGDGIREELGDLLFTLAMLARRREVDPEEALERANRKFTRRFRKMERLAGEEGVDMEHAGLQVLDRIWNRVKDEEDPG
jgi:MazG family protein